MCGGESADLPLNAVRCRLLALNCLHGARLAGELSGVQQPRLRHIVGAVDDPSRTRMTDVRWSGVLVVAAI
jgi:hypothetical protein